MKPCGVLTADIGVEALPPLAPPPHAHEYASSCKDTRLLLVVALVALPAVDRRHDMGVTLAAGGSAGADGDAAPAMELVYGRDNSMATASAASLL